MCEFHIHGGIAVISSIQRSLGKLPGFRPAEPGEFTKRAFLNGKLDLTRVEGIGDLLRAETEMQRRQAVLLLDGALHKQYEDWKQRFKKCVANIEAYIDFGEDENIESDVLENVFKELQLLQKEIGRLLSDERKGERVRNGVQVTIIGKPNVGKSTLFNIICQREAAIVSPISGTTRDVISTSLNILGYPVHISDTAGIRETQDIIECEGVTRAKYRALHSDLLITVVEAKELYESQLINAVENLLSDVGISLKDSSNLQKDLNHPDIFIVVNKSDLLNCREMSKWKCDPHLCLISCKNEEGIDTFIQLLGKRIESLCGVISTENPVLVRERHRIHLEECLRCIDSYLNNESKDLVVSARILHRGLLQLGKINGKVTTEEILDIVFKDFCIGK